MNSTSGLVQQEAQQLLVKFGDTGNGKLQFGTDIGNESVIGGSESGTYISIHDDAGQAVSEIQILNAEALPQTFVPPSQDYGYIDWTAVQNPDGSQGTGFNGESDHGKVYYFDSSNNNLYSGNEPGVDTSNADWVGDVRTYNFQSGSAVEGVAPATPSYGGIAWKAFSQPDGSISYWGALQSTITITPDPIEPPDPVEGEPPPKIVLPQPYTETITTYYNFGADGKLYTGSGAGNLARQELVGDVSTYNFAAT